MRYLRWAFVWSLLFAEQVAIGRLIPPIWSWPHTLAWATMGSTVVLLAVERPWER